MANKDKSVPTIFQHQLGIPKTTLMLFSNYIVETDSILVIRLWKKLKYGKVKPCAACFTMPHYLDKKSSALKLPMCNFEYTFELTFSLLMMQSFNRLDSN